MKRRVVMQVDLGFDKIIKNIQKEFMMKGEKRSTVDITASFREQDLKKLITEKSTDIEVNFDRRRR